MMPTHFPYFFSFPTDLQPTNEAGFVTDSTAGNGLAIAWWLAAKGTHIALTNRIEAHLTEAKAAILQQMPAVVVRGAAVNSEQAMQADNLLKQVLTVDILINNIGIFEPEAFVNITGAKRLRFFEVNVLSDVQLVR